MGRNKTRWPLELDDGLMGSLEDALDDQQKSEPELKRNEFLCRLLRRSLSQEKPSPAVSFVTASPRTMAEFRGDMDRLQRIFVSIRNAIINRNRGRDKDDPESVKRFDEDDKKTSKFLADCDLILTVAKDRAWTLRGLSTDQLRVARKILVKDWQANLKYAEGEFLSLKSKFNLNSDRTIPANVEETWPDVVKFAHRRIAASKLALHLLYLGESFEPIPLGANKDLPATMPQNSSPKPAGSSSSSLD